MQVLKWSQQRKQSQWVRLIRRGATVICVSSQIVKETESYWGKRVRLFLDRGAHWKAVSSVVKSCPCSILWAPSRAFASVSFLTLLRFSSHRLQDKKRFVVPRRFCVLLLFWSRALPLFSSCCNWVKWHFTKIINLKKSMEKVYLKFFSEYKWF